MTEVEDNRSDHNIKRSKRWAWSACLIIAIPLTVLVSQIDNWSRDLTTNVAWTDENSEDARLRPLRLSSNLQETRNLIIKAATNLDRWEVADIPKQNDTEIPLTRTTAVFGFVDDVVVRLQTEGEFTVVNATSQSRVGKADLGQNPRNIDQLFSEIRRIQDNG